MYTINKQEWKKIATKGDTPPSRSACQIAGFDTFFLLFGGYTRKNGDYFNDLHQFSLETNTWTQIKAKNPPPSRTDHVFIKISVNQCACFGGQNFIAIMNDLYIYKVQEREWIQINSDLNNPGPIPRFGHSACLIGSTIYIFGGWDGEKTLNDLWLYNLNTYRWKQQKQEDKITPRYRHSCVAYNKSLFVFGGVDIDQIRFDDLYEYNTQLSAWCKIETKAGGPTARSFQRAIQFNGELYIIGGFDGQRRNDMYKIDLNLAQIESASSVFEVISPKRNGFFEKVTKEQSYEEYQRMKGILLQSKQNQINSKSNVELPSQTSLDLFSTQKEAYDVQRQKQQKYRWFYLKEQGTIYPPRTGHSVVLIKEKMQMYLFGGVDDYGEKNSEVYKYCILTNTWSIVQIKQTVQNISISSQISLSNSVAYRPIARSGCRGVDIGNECILYFGGNFEKENGYLQEILVLNINKSEWQVIKPKNNNDQDIPQGRTDHVMVKYFHNIYIHGGCGGQEKKIFGDFYRFSLNSNKFKRIKCEQEERYQRFGHSGVIYNHSIYIFGGWDGVDCMNDMHQFSITTNIWYQVKDLGQRPACRYRHDAIMVQDKMYLFGGVDKFQKRFNDFFEFDMETKHWLQINTTGCIPTPRTFHRLICNENQIFILGGFNGLRNNEVYTMFVQQTTKKDHLNLEMVNQKTSLQDLSFLEDFVQDIIDDEKKEESTVVSVLKNQVKELSKKLQAEEEKSLCKICFIHEINALILECCHLVTCFECALIIKNCPICRKTITKVLKTYRH